MADHDWSCFYHGISEQHCCCVTLHQLVWSIRLNWLKMLTGYVAANTMMDTIFSLVACTIPVSIMKAMPMRMLAMAWSTSLVDFYTRTGGPG
eukprot:scaffold59115_cov62-Attheya_sp.AAC.4